MDDELKQLKHELHEQIDDYFRNADVRVPVELLFFRLAGRLVKAAEPLVDQAVGVRILPPSEGAKNLQELGAEARIRIKSIIHQIGPETREKTKSVGLAGACSLLTFINGSCDDPYLRELTLALNQLQDGQVHPWLVPNKKSGVHPRKHAHAVYELRKVPFCVIEYLFASGAYETKTRARSEVVQRLGREESTLKDWRNSLRRRHETDLQFALKAAQECGVQVTRLRSIAEKDNYYNNLIEWYDANFGLPAIDRVAKALANSGADKGQKS